MNARRALIADLAADRRGWLQHGVAALAISVLGLGVAASVSLTGAAQPTAARAVSTGSTGAVVQQVPEGNLQLAPRTGTAAAPDAAHLKSLADQRAEELAQASDDYSLAASTKSARVRDKSLADLEASTDAQAKRLADEGPAASDGPDLPSLDTGVIQGGGKACLPVASYHISARFGQVGLWARYHTGFDFAAPIGTPIRAPAAGVVTNAGIGPASGWAGNYVAIRYPDGSQTLMAHMSTVSVSSGQTVSPCQVVGAIGMTGRSFGPHLHFEAYPSGVVPGTDIYQAVNPIPWLTAHGLRP